jgi:two-component system, NtrC family, response regulator PilR
MGRKPKVAQVPRQAEPKKRSEIAVLVVDDEMNLTLAMRRLLSAEGYRTETANSGEEALHKAKESHYDIVFLDVNMPGMNGLETFVKLGQAAPNSAVVMITGYGKTLKAVIEEARSLGVRAVIDKPFKINQITEAIREIIPHAD